MKFPWLLTLLCSFLAQSVFAQITEELNLSGQFGGYTGAFALFDSPHNRWLRFNPDQCRTRSSPCSTFKILNSLVALETGVADGPDFKLPWDGVKRSIEAWNHDQTLRGAFSVSCVWYYEILAARIGLERYKPFLAAAAYGNKDLSGGLPHFWIESSLTISPDEQVQFLRELYSRNLPFSPKTVDAVLDIMTLSSANGITFRGKSGTGGDAGDIAILGWFVGSVSDRSGDYFFATRITGGNNPSGKAARKITESILASLELLPAHK